MQYLCRIHVVLVYLQALVSGLHLILVARLQRTFFGIQIADFRRCGGSAICGSGSEDAFPDGEFVHAIKGLLYLQNVCHQHTSTNMPIGKPICPTREAELEYAVTFSRE